MTNIFVDPVIVITPPDDATRDDIELYLNTLTIWLKEALYTPYSWLHSVQVTDLLQDSRRFPSFELLRTWQRKYQLNLNVSQLVRNVNAFFRDPTLDLGGKLEHLGFLIEPADESIIIQPGEFSARWPNPIRDEMHLLFATTCACKHAGEPSHMSLVLRR